MTARTTAAVNDRSGKRFDALLDSLNPVEQFAYRQGRIHAALDQLSDSLDQTREHIAEREGIDPFDTPTLKRYFADPEFAAQHDAETQSWRDRTNALIDASISRFRARQAAGQDWQEGRTDEQHGDQFPGDEQTNEQEGN